MRIPTLLISVSLLAAGACSGSGHATPTAPTSTVAASTFGTNRPVASGDITPPLSVRDGAIVTNRNEIVPTALLGLPLVCPGRVPDVVGGPLVLHFLNHETQNPDGSYHVVVFMNIERSDVTGQVTGIKYQVTGAHQLEFNLTAGASTSTLTNNFRIEAPGPDMDYTLHVLQHTTIDAQGVPTTSIDKLAVECSVQP